MLAFRTPYPSESQGRLRPQRLKAWLCRATVCGPSNAPKLDRRVVARASLVDVAMVTRVCSIIMLRLTSARGPSRTFGTIYHPQAPGG